MNFVTIGKIIGTHGLKGYIKTKPEHAFYELIDKLPFISIIKENIVLSYELEHYFHSRTLLIIKLKGIDHIDTAKLFVGSTIACPENIYKKLNISDNNFKYLLGFNVISENKNIGFIDEYYDFNGNIVFKIININTKECFLFSYNKQSIVNIDRENKYIIINKNYLVQNDL